MGRAIATLEVAGLPDLLDGVGGAVVDSALGEESGGVFVVEGGDGVGEKEGGGEGEEEGEVIELHFGSLENWKLEGWKLRIRSFEKEWIKAV